MRLGELARKRGACADRPSGLSSRAWREVGRRVWLNSGRVNLSLLASGVAFNLFLSLVPVLGAMVMIYGLAADPATVAANVHALTRIIPPEAARLIDEQMTGLVRTAAATNGLKLALALAVALYGGTRAAIGLMTSLNVIYGQAENRSFVRQSVVALALIAGLLAIGLAGLLVASLVGYIGVLLGQLGDPMTTLFRLASWAAAALLASTTIAAIYRFAPHRADAKWRWLSLGSVLATSVWAAGTFAFGLYVAWFGSYNPAYGSLGAVVVLLLWLHISAYAILLGGLLNAEAERQTARDSTTGRPRPMGERGAVVADTSAALDLPVPAEGSKKLRETSEPSGERVSNDRRPQPRHRRRGAASVDAGMDLQR